MILKKIDLKSVFQKLNTFVSEDMSDYDPDARYDTRVKLPEWQLKKLKQRKQAKKDLWLLIRIENYDMP